MEVFPVVTIAADKVGDCAEDLIRYGGMWGGHGFVRRRERPVAFMIGAVRMVNGGERVRRCFWR